MLILMQATHDKDSFKVNNSLTNKLKKKNENEEQPMSVTQLLIKGTIKINSHKFGSP